MNIVLVTGGFDPVHSGHIEYFKAAKALGDRLVVGVNSDLWLERKKGKAFMPLHERIRIIENLKMVDECIVFNDADNTAKNAILVTRGIYHSDKIIFANGGDRTSENIPETGVIDENLEFIFGVGGSNKMNSSSWILEEWKAPKTERPWGYYRVLHEVPGTKVKELTVEPGKSLSMQRHANRSEYWHVSEGRCEVAIITDKKEIIAKLTEHSDIEIAQGAWHRLSNPYDEPCKIVEIQFGTECSETDIERHD